MPVRRCWLLWPLAAAVAIWGVDAVIHSSLFGAGAWREALAVRAFGVTAYFCPLLLAALLGYGLVVRRLILRCRRSERELAEALWRYRTPFEISRDAVVAVDEAGRVALFNPAAESMFGWRAEEILGQPMQCLVPPAHHDFAREQLHRLLSQGPAQARVGQTGEVQLRRRDGEECTVECAVSAAWAGGRPLVVAVVRDVSQRKQSEHRLRASEAQLRTLLETLPQMIFYKDPNSVYVYANGNYARDLGSTPDQIVGKTDYDFYPTELADKYRADDRRVMASGQTEQIEEPYLRDGEQLTVHTVKTPVRDDQGRVAGILGIFWDITEHKRMERALEAKNRELEAFVYTVSHDLRAPLISVEGFTHLLCDEYADRLDHTGRDYLHRIRSNIEHMSVLLLDLLELSRVGRQEEPRELVPAGEVVAEVLAGLAAAIEGAGAGVEVAPDLPAVRCARARLSQVFGNLISNAIKFAAPDRPPPHRDRLAAHRQRLALPRQGQRHRHRRRPPAQGLRDLQPRRRPGARWRRRRPRYRPARNRGPRRRGGRGEHARRRLHFLVHLSRRGGGNGARDMSNPITPVTILLVEDNQDHAFLIQTALRDSGVLNDIRVVATGEEALDYLHQRAQYAAPESSPRPGLILLDVRLPGIDGIEVLRDIKGDPHLRLIPVVMLTSSEAESDLLASYDAGANSYIQKPVAFPAFAETVRRLHLYWVLVNTPPPG